MREEHPSFRKKARKDGPPASTAIGQSKPSLRWEKRRRVAALQGQMPANQAYPASGEAEPKPLPNCLRLSVTVNRVMYLTLL
jgi:hypothetical protein